MPSFLSLNNFSNLVKVTQYTGPVDRLLRLAGNPSRLFFMAEWNEDEISTMVNVLQKRICSEGDLEPLKPAVPTLPAAEECFEEEHKSWGRPVCCAQVDLFIGIQAVGEKNSLETQINAIEMILDGFVTGERHLLVSVGILFDSGRVQKL